MAEQRGERTVTFDDPMVLVVLSACLYFGGWAAWHFGHAYISAAYGYLRYAQFYAFNVLGEAFDVPGLRLVHQWIAGLCGPEDGIGACTRDFTTVTWAEVRGSSIWVNLVLLSLLSYYCVRLFLRLHATHPKLRFRKLHTIDSFVKELRSARNPKDGKLLYPHLGLFSSIDLISQSLDHPLWGMSESSRQFAYRRQLIAGWRPDPGGGEYWVPTLDRERAATVFRRQLGKHWTSSAQLSPGETLLVAIAVPRVAATDASLDDATFKAAMAASDDMVRFCWSQFKPPAPRKGAADASDADPHAWLRPEIDLSLARDVIKRYIGHPAVQAVLVRHAFNRTVIFGLFMQARRLGVLQAAEMRWLRFYDRPLWYMLQTVGRPAGFAEAAAVLSHYLYEVKAGCGIVEPQVDKAVSGLDLAINSFKTTSAEKARYEDSATIAAAEAVPSD